MLLLLQHSLGPKSEHDTSVTGKATDTAVMEVHFSGMYTGLQCVLSYFSVLALILSYSYFFYCNYHREIMYQLLICYLSLGCLGS